ncbi:MAG: hypothetical protein IKM06_07065 [Clostridia bacterium]|nr:hypothetical protein [Clostridia bacterium]
MLYKKNNEKSLSNELFKNPTSEFRGAPFWAWNTKLDDKTLEEQIDIFKEMGIGGFHAHVRTGMATEYLSDEFMHFIKVCNEKAKKEDMLCWLYDEDRWPSGATGGFVTKNYRHRQRAFHLEPTDPRDREFFAKSYDEYLKMTENNGQCSGYFISRFGITLDENGFLTDYKRLDENEDYDGDIWYGYMYIGGASGWYNGQSYIDTLSKAAVEEFVRITYDAYYNAVGEDFGKSIPAIFTDEPQVPMRRYLSASNEKKLIAVPYTDDFEETYKSTYGESIIEKMPELFWEKKNNGCAKTRYNYVDHMCERFVSAFVDTVGEWCIKHNIAFTGHMMQEPTLRSQTDSLGEAMRCYRNFQLPGMDLLCDRIEYTTAKQVQSAVHQYGREGMLSELYGVTGWDYNFRGHKRQGDWQAALGVTIRVHHLTWVSMNGDAKHDYPASIGYQSPWYKQYSYIEDHFARLNTALTRGTPDVRVGVIHPVESFWLYTGPNDKTALRRGYLDEQFVKLTNSLSTSGIDFDFISESLLPDLCVKGGNPLKVGKMAYDCVIVPVMETIRKTTLDRLKAFVNEGGRVILLGTAPTRVDGDISDLPKEEAKHWDNIDIDYNTLIDRLEAFRSVNFLDTYSGVRCNNVLHQLRNDENGKWLFFCHGEDQADRDGYVPAFSSEKICVTLNGSYDVTEYNTLTGEIYTPEYKIENGKTYVEYTMFTEDSFLLWLTPAKADKLEKGNAPKRALPMGINATALFSPSNKNFIARIPDKPYFKTKDLVEYTLDEPNVILLDMAEYAFDGGEYSSHLEDSARIGDIGRGIFYKEHLMQTSVQPWVPVPDSLKNDKGHTVKRRFTFHTDITLENACLALEESETATITVNGERISNEACGWYVDKCIKKVKLPTLNKGKVVIEIEIPFFLRGRTEWCYVLGDFGVKVAGKNVTAIPRAARLAYGDAVHQTLPFYTGNITYHTSYVEKEESAVRTLQIPDIAGALARVSVDGKDLGVVAISPYCLSLGEMTKGEHKIDITVFGTRFNGFGPIHNNVKRYPYWGPNSWRTYDSPMWNDCYILRPTGILNNPTVY